MGSTLPTPNHIHATTPKWVWLFNQACSVYKALNCPLCYLSHITALKSFVAGDIYALSCFINNQMVKMPLNEKVDFEKCLIISSTIIFVYELLKMILFNWQEWLLLNITELFHMNAIIDQHKSYKIKSFRNEDIYLINNIHVYRKATDIFSG